MSAERKIIEQELERVNEEIVECGYRSYEEKRREIYLLVKKDILEDLLEKFDVYTEESKKVSERVHKAMSDIERRKIDLYLRGIISEDELKGSDE